MGKRAKIKKQRKSERSQSQTTTEEQNPPPWIPSWLQKRFPNLKISFVELMVWSIIFGVSTAIILKPFIYVIT
ncbi:MAG: hypothetical protein GDA44_07315 [Prochloron sp. SP5CPC1]|nr:hypothetical protein [Candidatus Paraprochloron terpiosi SP5CPC1]